MKKVAPVRPDYDKANYDISGIAPYKLEDPLTFLDGSRVQGPADWEKRRQEILSIFASEMFGREPPLPQVLITEKVEEKDGALAGFAVRSQYKMYFKEDKSGPVIDWLLLRPRYAGKPVPVIIFLNYQGNHELIPDKEVFIPEMWGRFPKDYSAEASRGILCNPNSDSVVPVGELISAGYAVLTACYCQVSPDPDYWETDPALSQDTFPYTKVFDLWGKRDENRTDDITSLGAWAWSLSRGLDLAERISEIDAERNIVTGYSRLGKSALLAAARDSRFAACVPVQCGGGGATLAKRDYGENIATEMRMFKHWYCKAYKKYETNPAELLTFDQHLLLAAIAPRKLLVAGYDEPWFDTEGEFIACRAASPAWEIFGLGGLPDVDYPSDFETSAIGTHLGYYRRSEGHGIAPFDWRMLEKFAEADN